MRVLLFLLAAGNSSASRQLSRFLSARGIPPCVSAVWLFLSLHLFLLGRCLCPSRASSPPRSAIDPGPSAASPGGVRPLRASLRLPSSPLLWWTGLPPALGWYFLKPHKVLSLHCVVKSSISPSVSGCQTRAVLAGQCKELIAWWRPLSLPAAEGCGSGSSSKKARVSNNSANLKEEPVTCRDESVQLFSRAFLSAPCLPRSCGCLAACGGGERLLLALCLP